MGFLDFLVGAAGIIDALTDNDVPFTVKCDTLELFEIGTSWRGTARVHGAGAHVRSVNVDYSTTVRMPSEDDYNQTKRDILRKRLRSWASETFANGSTLPKEAIVLNEGENCLTCEGFVTQIGNRWVITSNSRDAKYYGAYKLYIKKRDENIGYEDLQYYFKEETTARIYGVDVHDGF